MSTKYWRFGSGVYIGCHDTLDDAMCGHLSDTFRTNFVLSVVEGEPREVWERVDDSGRWQKLRRDAMLAFCNEKLQVLL